jgi:hypothetical protein
MKTAELIGAALDWAVANCEGIGTKWFDSGHLTINGEIYSPSTDWAQAGPIIELEGIGIECHLEGTQWFAQNYWGEYESSGPTALIAAMRCYVASKLGETVEVPAELTGA